MPYTVAVGLIDDSDFESLASAVGRALEVELHQRNGLNIGGGAYFSNWSPSQPDPEIHFVRNLGPDDSEWKYEDDRDVPYVVLIWGDQLDLDVEELVRRLAKVAREARVLEAR